MDTAIGLSKLLFRLDDDIGVAKTEYHLFVLETLRAEGYHALGGEDLVFDRQNTEEAQALLGGTVVELDCLGRWRTGNCRIGIEWQLLDVRTEEVVYEVLARHRILGLEVENLPSLGRLLIGGAVKSLAQRPAFRKALGAIAEAQPSQETIPPGTLKRCAVPARPLPAGAESALDATVIIETKDGWGSGFFLNEDGHLITNAHVAEGQALRVHTRDGRQHAATILRSSRNTDAALLHVEGFRSTCLQLQPANPAIGADVFVLGSPTGKTLGFSLARGVVSGNREFEHGTAIQTDASVSPGNSGGPLVDADGRAIGIVTAKLVDEAVEGIAFAVPVSSALDALSLEWGEVNQVAVDPSDTTEETQSTKVTDTPDPLLSIDPDGDRGRRIREATPTYVKVMKWGGLSLAAAGTAVVGWSAISYSTADEPTRSDFESARLLNDVGWLALGVGGAAFAASFFLVPDDPGPQVDAAGYPETQVGIRIAPSTVHLDVRF